MRILDDARGVPPRRVRGDRFARGTRAVLLECASGGWGREGPEVSVDERRRFRHGPADGKGARSAEDGWEGRRSRGSRRNLREGSWAGCGEKGGVSASAGVSGAAKHSGSRERGLNYRRDGHNRVRTQFEGRNRSSDRVEHAVLGGDDGAHERVALRGRRRLGVLTGGDCTQNR